MKFGISLIPTDRSSDLGSLVQAVENLGFESFWIIEGHTHIPTSRRTPPPGGGELAEYYRHTLDPFVALTIVALNSTKLLIGTGVLLLAQHDPISTAKAFATLDFVTGGRMICGVGGGYLVEEIENHGTIPRQRWRLLRERVLAMKEIWAKEESEFHGDLVRFGPMWSWPKPKQQVLPVYIGGNVDNSLKRVVDYGDGWMPVSDTAISFAQMPLSEQIPIFRKLCDEAGRGYLPITVFGCRSNAEDVAKYRSLGVDRIVFGLHVDGQPHDAVTSRLDEIASVAV